MLCLCCVCMSRRQWEEEQARLEEEQRLREEQEAKRREVERLRLQEVSAIVTHSQ